MNVLVTGANGQLAQSLKEFVTTYHPNELENYHFVTREELDICDSSKLVYYLTYYDIKVLVNCAAYTDVEKAENDLSAVYDANGRALSTLGAACRMADVKVIHISTDYVFDGTSYKPYTEKSKTNSINRYGESKLLGENNLINSLCKYIIIRSGWLYSEYGKNFFKTMLKLTSENEEVKVIYDQIGTPTYCRDLAECIYQFINNDINNEIFNFSNEGVCSWYDFAYKINKLAYHDSKIIPVKASEYKTKARRPHFSVLDKTKIKNKLNIEIPHWENALERCLLNLYRNTEG